MPLFIIKKVFNYCTYDKPFFILVLILFGLLNFIFANYTEDNVFVLLVIEFLMYVLIYGYGMTITRDRINDGIRLPKILVKDVISLGFKYSIVFTVYLYVQGLILDFVCSPLNFPHFDLEEMLLDFSGTIHLLFSHNPIHTLIFLIVGASLFYITAFFMEIALARLADTGSIVDAFKLLDIKNDIDLVGWRHYAKEYTLIIITIVFFAYLKHFVVPFTTLNYVWNVLLNLLIFTTQFLGIGAIYSVIKEKKSK